MLKKALILFLGILILLQFYRPAKNIDPQPQPLALKTQYSLPSNLEYVLKAACYDCHSNNTSYPWYAEIQPVNLYLARHVNEGKRELNFDEFLSYSRNKQLKKMKETVEVMEKQEMPLTSYTLIHRDAVLSEDQRREIVTWAKKVSSEIESSAVQNN